MAVFFCQLFNKRKSISSASSDESNNSPEAKMPKQCLSPKLLVAEQEDDKVITTFNMAENIGLKLQEILSKLDKLDSIEVAVKNIEANLKNLEKRTKKLEEFQTAAKKDMDELKSANDFVEQQLKEKDKAWKKAHEKLEVQLKELAGETQKNQELINEINTKNLYLESYSRRENIKFTNIKEVPSIDGRNEDTEEVLCGFLQLHLGFKDANSVEIRRVHRVGKNKDGRPQPILARFLRYKDCQKIFSLAGPTS